MEAIKLLTCLIFVDGIFVKWKFNLTLLQDSPVVSDLKQASAFSSVLIKTLSQMCDFNGMKLKVLSTNIQ